MLQSVMVSYGLAVALIAVSVWQTHADASAVVSQEATALAALYRNVTGYLEPVRTSLQNELVIMQPSEPTDAPRPTKERRWTTSSPHFADSQERWILMIC
jgi:hypothetical protein